MGNLGKYGEPPFTVAVVHGGPGAPGEMSTVARELSSIGGVLEPLLTAASVNGQVEELEAVLKENGRLPLSLIGFSWGAWLSVIFTAHLPDIRQQAHTAKQWPFRGEVRSQHNENTAAETSEGRKKRG